MLHETDMKQLAEAVNRRCFVRKVFFKTSAKFTGKDLCLSLFFNRSATLLKKRLQHRCFPVNFAKFIKTHFLLNTSGDYFLIGNI